MLAVPQNLKDISHPLVASMYMEKDKRRQNTEDVLVIEAAFPETESNSDAYDSYLMDLLLDLESLKDQAESRVGKFDRVDIRDIRTRH